MGLRRVLFFLLMASWPAALLAQSDTLDRYVIVEDFRIEGNKVTKPNIILREMVFEQGDTVAKMELIPELQRSKDNILNLSIFNFVNMNVEHLPGNRIIVEIEVQERWYIWPTPIFEHGERNLSTFLKEPRWSRLNYGLWLKWNNFRGRNEFLNAKIRLGYKEQYVLQYEKPNLGINENHKFSLSYSLSRQYRINYTTEDNLPVFFRDEENYSFNTSSAFVAYTYRPELYSRHRLRFHYVDDRITDTIATLNPGFFGEGYTRHKYFKADYVFRYDVRDSRVYPLEGEAVKVKLQRFGMGIISQFPYGNWEAEGTFFYHRKMADRFYMASVTKGKVATNGELPLYLSKGLGYAENMTSYDAYVIDGKDFLVSKLILKFELVKPSTFTVPFLNIKQFSKVHYAVYLNLLGDVGYVNNPNPYPTNFMVNEWQYSTGIGLDFVTYYDKVFGIEFAVNRYGTTGFFFHVTTPFFEW